MKDLPHHIKKLNRKVIRSVRREERENEVELPDIPPRKQTERELKKQAKSQTKAKRLSRTPSDPTPEERNKRMKKRVPMFDRNKAAPKHARSSKKKTPRI